MYDLAVVGGGIVGLSTTRALLRSRPGAKLLLLEKEPRLASHQTGHNSGVIHSGVYYKPGSLKARYAREGARTIVKFCQERGIAHEVCGKLVVATSRDEMPRLEHLHRRGLENGLKVEKVGPEAIREIEPHATGVAALKVPETGIVDYPEVARALAEDVKAAGGEVRTGTEVRDLSETAGGVELNTNRGSFQARALVNCAGLHSDRIARLSGVEAGARIVPFRGEYYELRPGRRYLVKNIIYPLPDPDFPFLNVHLTRTLGGGVEAGPNAVLGLAREGYGKLDVCFEDLAETLAYPAFWRLARRYWRTGVREFGRSLSKKAFTRSLQRLVPEIVEDDLLPAEAGVRAQALGDDGTLVDDFFIVEGRRTVHVLNAPSPAATAAIPIGEEVARRVAALGGR